MAYTMPVAVRQSGSGLAVAMAIWACGGGTSSGNGFLGFVGDAGPGGGSALCGPNGTNACPATKQCDVTLGCVDCVTDSQCPAAARFCLQGSCVACESNTDCGTGTTPACFPGTHTCHAACTTNAQCTGRAATICDTAAGVCVGCNTATDCPAAAKVCGATTETCVECAGNSDCPAAAPRCLASNGTCVECVGNSDCGTSAPVCSPETFMCRAGCTADSQCAAAAPHCDTATSTCVQCTADANCAGTATPFCSTGPALGGGGGMAGRCVQCDTDTQCSGATPRCVAGICGL